VSTYAPPPLSLPGEITADVIFGGNNMKKRGEEKGKILNEKEDRGKI
jgi:hypothetical protein